MPRAHGEGLAANFGELIKLSVRSQKGKKLYFKMLPAKLFMQFG